MASSKKKCIIIGAGYAGLAAARTLVGEGGDRLEVVVLEAGHRVGGRAHTESLGQCGYAEFGATWLHGVVNHPVYEAALRLKYMDGTEKERAGMQWGTSQYVLEGAAAALEGADALAAAKAAPANGGGGGGSSAVPAAAGSIGTFVRQRFQQLDLAARGNVACDAWAWRERLQRAIDGCHTTDDMNAASMAEYHELPGPNIPLPCGYQAVAEHFAEGLDIRFGQRVERVRYDAHGVHVTVAGGAELAADAVIVTVSLGVLKAEHEHMFSPPLPPCKASAIAALAMGCVDKLFIEFGAAVGPAQASCCAVMWITGADAVAMEAATDEEVCRGVQGVLDAFPAISLAGRPFRVRRTRWGADPLFRGSYSYCPAGARAADMDALAAPVVSGPSPNPGPGGAAGGQAAPPRVLFAGEATHRSYFGTVHGAYFSGQREARRLLAAFGVHSGAHVLSSIGSA
ncbi:hypothetical protein WJX81_003289 [Elliptochloris bilobata]|uniref:Amine oxidase domain-containing protein n=1 Tax=Elliptochloris bilobata TaxID=381761 RepID=A0AAW1SEJ7_9CHLO